MDPKLEKSILATIAYFDVFNYPLTIMELERLLLGRGHEQADTEAIWRALEQSPLLAKAVRQKNGVYHARGQEARADARRERFVVTQEKYQRSRRALRLLSVMPFVRGLFICNSMALDNAHQESDVDVVVVAKKGGIWWARLFCLAALSWLSRRPGQSGNKTKICLSFFVDEARLDVSDLRMGERDIDFAYWIANFYPVYDAANFYARFWAANRYWLSRLLPNAGPIVAHPSRAIPHGIISGQATEFLLAPFWRAARAIQEKKFPDRIRQLKNRDTRVRVEDGLLKFHVNDRRVEHMEAFVARYESLLAL